MSKKNRKNAGYEKFMKSEPIHKKNKPVDSVEKSEKCRELVKYVYQCKEDEKYEDALKAVIDLFNMGYVKVEILYQLVDIYNLIGDYERAIVWGEKTLSIDNGHIPTMLRLGDIYAIKNNVNDCLAMIERILCVGEETLTIEQRELIDEMLDYIDSDYELESLKEKLPTTYNYISREITVLPSDSASDKLVLKEELNNEEAEGVEPEKEEVNCQDDICKEVDMQAETVNERKKLVPELDVTEEQRGEVVENLITSIMTQRISLREKVEQCNSLATGYYIQGNFSGAVLLLKQALEIDGKDEQALKNWAFMLVKCGENEMALRCLLDMRSNDMMIADLIKELKGDKR